MNYLKHIIFVIIVSIVLCSCNNHFALTQRIKKYEKHNFSTSIYNISILSEKQAFYFSDSANVLEKELEIFINAKNKKFNYELKDIELRINKLMKDKSLSKNQDVNLIIENRIKFLKNKQAELSKIMDIYKNNPAQTQINTYQALIQKYKATPDSIIGYKIAVKFNAKTGYMPEQLVTKNYLFSADLKKVIDVLKDYN